ncbi:phosphotriesterase-related protein [Pectinophora gossypiella]|uniref:phosphotriesterase-related protein n=1 Tax=Pectinophora gossypiella TaxID=13191 RepID=UPI00214EFD4C|nr:phosphotriesterase-related protein [Pectinophora gossypiella]
MIDKVQTVLGPVNPSELGRTLTHEHLAMEFTHFYNTPPTIIADKFQSGFSLDKVGYLRQYPYSSQFNLLLNDDSAKTAVLNDVKEYKRCGGGTIVENSTEGLKRDVNFYRQVSEATGVHIVAGTGYYIEDVQGNASKSSGEQMYNHMLKELTEGCVDNKEIKAGFMGEIASVWPLKEFERRAIKAVGELQPQVGCGVSFHPHRVMEAPFEIIRLYLEAGGKADKAVMSHLDRTIFEDDKFLEFSDLGTYCQLDLFGIEVSYYQLHVTTNMPSDAQRLDKVELMIREGKADQLLMSHDIHTKHRLIDFGGHGYCHIINNVLPRMRARGISQEIIDKITIENPAKWLSVKV